MSDDRPGTGAPDPADRTASGPGARRRALILDAGARVIAEQGVRAFTFRSVAQEAGIPLGSTTYHFADRDLLLVETVRRARDRSRTVNEELMRALIAEHGMPRALAEFVEEFTVRRPDELARNYRIYTTVLYQPSLEPEIATWRAEDVLREYLGDYADAAARLLEGYLIEAVMHRRGYTVEEVAPAFARLLGETG